MFKTVNQFVLPSKLKFENVKNENENHRYFLDPSVSCIFVLAYALNEKDIYG